MLMIMTGDRCVALDAMAAMCSIYRMPFMVGIHSSFLPEVRQMSGTEDQLVFVMLDEGEVQFEGVERSPVDSMPPAVVRRLNRRLTTLRQQMEEDTAGWRVVNPMAGGVCVGTSRTSQRLVDDPLL